MLNLFWLVITGTGSASQGGVHLCRVCRWSVCKRRSQRSCQHVAHAQGTPARVVAVSSMGHQLQDMKLDDLVRERGSAPRVTAVVLPAGAGMLHCVPAEAAAWEVKHEALLIHHKSASSYSPQERFFLFTTRALHVFQGSIPQQSGKRAGCRARSTTGAGRTPRTAPTARPSWPTSCSSRSSRGGARAAVPPYRPSGRACACLDSGHVQTGAGVADTQAWRRAPARSAACRLQRDWRSLAAFAQAQEQPHVVQLVGFNGTGAPWQPWHRVKGSPLLAQAGGQQRGGVLAAPGRHPDAAGAPRRHAGRHMDRLALRLAGRVLDQVHAAGAAPRSRTCRAAVCRCDRACHSRSAKFCGRMHAWGSPL
jgi:hypothetical protein